MEGRSEKAARAEAGAREVASLRRTLVAELLRTPLGLLEPHALPHAERQSAIAAYEVASAEFHAASSVIDLRLIDGFRPDTEEFFREEIARMKLLLARRRLYVVPQSRPRGAETSEEIRAG